MRYDVTRSCGHEEEVQLIGPNARREAELSRMRRTPCDACAARAAREADEADGMAPVSGSDRQVPWASDIRRRLLDSLSSLRSQVEADPGYLRATDEQRTAIAAAFEEAAGKLRSEESARWLIDHESAGGLGLLAELCPGSVERRTP